MMYHRILLINAFQQAGPRNIHDEALPNRALIFCILRGLSD